MNYAKIFTTLTFLGLISLCAINAGNGAKLKKEIRSVKNSLKRIKKQMSDLRESIELSGRGEEKIFTAAFRLNMDADEDHSEAADNDSESETEFYTLREHNGIIGVFDDGDELVREIDRQISTLEAPDRQSLLLGIKIDSESELDKIVESLK